MIVRVLLDVQLVWIVAELATPLRVLTLYHPLVGPASATLKCHGLATQGEYLPSFLRDSGTDRAVAGLHGVDRFQVLVHVD